MWKEDEFFNEFRQQNDNVKPSEDFKARLSATVQQESNSKVVAFNRNIRRISAAAAAIAVVAVCGSVIGINMLTSNNSESETSKPVNVQASGKNSESDSKGTYSFDAEKISIEAVAQDIIGGAKVVKGVETLDETASKELASKLVSAEILEKALDEESENTYTIYGNDTWVVEEYQSGDLYIYAK